MSREVLQRLERQLERLSTPGQMRERIDLAKQAMELTKEYPDRWAEFNLILAQSHLLDSRDDPARNIELALQALLHGLTEVGEDEYRNIHAQYQHLLAQVYLQRVHGEPLSNIEAAILAAQKATYLRRTDKAKHIAGFSLRVLGEAYLKRIAGKRAENIEEALRILEEARQLLPRDITPKEWAETSLLMVDAYRQRINCDRHVNAGMGIGILQNVLPYFPKAKHPLEWAKVHWFMGQLYYEQFTLGSTANLELAIACFSQAATVYAATTYPQEYARIQYELGHVYLVRVEDSLAQNLDWAIGLFHEAVKYASPVKSPREWVAANLAAARTYRWRLQGDANENVELAIACCQAAVDVCTQHRLYLELSEALYLLAECLAESAKGLEPAQYDQGLQHLERALKILDRAEQPERYAQVQLLRGRLLLERRRGDPANNIEHAIKALRTALDVAPRDTLPFTWAAGQHLLGVAYTRRRRGDEATNIEQALAAFAQAVTVRTFDDHPRLWAATLHAQAQALSRRRRGQPDDNLNRAIKSHEDAFTVNWQYLLHEEWLQARIHMALLIAERRDRTGQGDDRQVERAWQEVSDFFFAQIPTHDQPRYLGQLWAVTRRRQHFRRLHQDYNSVVQLFERTVVMLSRRDLVLANSAPMGLTEEQQNSYWAALDQWRLLSAWSRKLMHAPTLKELQFGQLWPLRDNMQAVYRTLRELSARDPDFSMKYLTMPEIGALARARDVTLVYLLVGQSDEAPVEAYCIHPNAAAERLPPEDVLSFPLLTRRVVQELLYARLDEVAIATVSATPDFGWLAAHARWCTFRDAEARRLWKTTIRRQMAHLGDIVAGPLVRFLQDRHADRVILLCDPWLAIFPWHALPCTAGKMLGDLFRLEYAAAATIFAKNGSWSA